MAYDLVLSSGYLAFARHAGFLKAVEEAGFEIGAVQGTSAGALAGALWASGMSAQEVLAHLTEHTPLWSLRPKVRVWDGVFSLAPMIRRLAEQLPATFEELPRPFAVGVMDGEGGHRLIRSGPLPQAVAASAAIPRFFMPVTVGGARYQDGGFVQRLGMEAWRGWRGPHAKALVHRIARSSGSPAEEDFHNAVLVESPRSFAKIWSLGDVEGRFSDSRVRALRAFERVAR